MMAWAHTRGCLLVVLAGVLCMDGADAFAPMAGMLSRGPSMRTLRPVAQGAVVGGRGSFAPRRCGVELGNCMQRSRISKLSMQMNPKDAAAESDENTYAAALRNTGLLVAAAGAFGAGVYGFMGPDAGLSWFTGYILEESLSVDNLFVFILLFNYFKVPRALQNRVLKWGIIGACVLRGLFIGAGIVAINSFRPVLLAFAGFLVFSSFKMLTSGDDDDDDDDLSNNEVVKFASGIVKSTSQYDGDKFFTMVDGVKRATPLLLVLVCVELSDILFAVDSIPAIFGVTEDPFIIFTSNIFAILGLRALFQVVSKLMENLEYLEPAVAVVLGLVGIKMIGEFAGFDVPEATALGVVLSVLSAGVGASLLKNSKEE